MSSPINAGSNSRRRRRRPYDDPVVWAKADMLATVSFDRLDLFRTSRDQTGRRRYLHPALTPEDLQRVHTCILFALGLGYLTP